MTWITNFLSSDLTMAAPLLICGLGALFGEKSGVINIGYEGLMTAGAFFGVVVSWSSGSVFAGAGAAMLAAMLLNLLFAFFVINLHANQVVTGLAINILAAGITTTLNRSIFGASATVPAIDVFDRLPVPLLSRLPVLGNTVFNQFIVVYAALLLVPVSSFIFNRTHIGLKVRSVGEHPLACDTLGINVYRVRYGGQIAAGLMAGLGGAFISMGQLSFFVEGMVAGRGFMALAAVVFGNFTPAGVLGASLLFGAADALKYRLQTTVTWIPYQAWLILPYLITLTALTVYRRRSNSPASQGIPYVKGSG
ncbi:MAG: ABC transporter permease [Treponema sp.]|jgi:simple sugar transport system permease protein|nr:ABC transporter permease [Treponema sp.]